MPDDYLQGIEDERTRIRDGINLILDKWNDALSADTVKLLIMVDGVVEGE